MMPQFIARQIVGITQRLFKFVGFDLVDNRPAPQHRGIKDADYYRPLFSPWFTPEWREKLHADDSHSLVPLHARYVLYSLALDAVRRCTGDVAECGVYRGGSAKLLAGIASDRTVYLFDTFHGMPATDPSRDLHLAGDFADTSLDAVREYLSGHKNVELVPGLVPESLEVIEHKTFAFVHIDLDIYSAIKAACEFFYSRMQPGGVLLFDDYGYSSCPGARLAIEEFFADKPETPLVMETGQCSIVRSSISPIGSMPQCHANGKRVSVMSDLLTAIENLKCPSCDHRLGLHASENGCGFDQGVRRDIHSGNTIENLGICRCDGVKREVIAAIAAIQQVHMTQESKVA